MMREPMLIDGIPLSNYGGKLLDWNPGIAALTNMVSPGTNYSFPRLLNSQVTSKTLTATVDIIGTNYADAMRKTSAFLLAVNKTCELFMPDGFYYRSALTGVSSFTWPTKWMTEFTLTFQSVQHGPLTTITVVRGNYPIKYPGTAPAGFMIEFTAPHAFEEFSILGITVYSIPAGGKIVIDGIGKTVTQDGTNKFSETDLVNFPMFDPQEADVVISMSETIPVKLSYYPAYL